MKTLIKNEQIGYEVLIEEPYKNQPMIVIFPGGGYHHLSTREAEPVANKFLSFGYNVAIVKYSVAPYADFIQLKQGLEVVELLSKTYEKIVVCGFSAGGHLAGLVATEKAKNNIKAMILCYPVITLCDKTHLGTRINLLANGNDTLENRNKYSIDQRVDTNTVPCFIWTTKTDNSVPYENTLMMIEALEKHNVFHKYHLFEKGPHGMALADETAIKDGDTSFVDKEVAKWPDMANNFLKETLK